MNDNIITAKELEKARKKAARREWFTEKKQQVKDFMTEHKDVVIVLAPVIIGGVVKLAKIAMKTYNLGKEEELKNRYCYDRSLGHYWKLRRELTNDEWVEIERRRKNGERLGDILDEMKVLA